MKNIKTATGIKEAIRKMMDSLGMSAKRFGYFGIKASKDANMLLISELTGKLEGFHSVSTSPETSAFCERMSHCKGAICEKCFSRRSIVPELGGYKKGLRANLAHNSEWLNQPHELSDFPELNDLYFRIESHGDVDTVMQAVNLVKLVLRNPKTSFTAWTKNPVAWDKAFKEMGGKPANLIMIYSSPMINVKVNLVKLQRVFPWIDKTFTVYDPEYLLNNEQARESINCGARQCMACKLCYTMNDVQEINEILK